MRPRSPVCGDGAARFSPGKDRLRSPVNPRCAANPRESSSGREQLRAFRARSPEQRGVAHSADARARGFALDLLAQSSAFVAILSARETQLHELARVELTIQFDEKLARDAVASEPRVIGQRLAETAELRFLRAGESGKRHARNRGETVAREKLRMTVLVATLVASQPRDGCFPSASAFAASRKAKRKFKSLNSRALRWTARVGTRVAKGEAHRATSKISF